MNRRNFLKNLGLLSAAPLMPGWVDWESFNKVEKKAGWDNEHNLLIFYKGDVIAYTDKAKLKMNRDMIDVTTVEDMINNKPRQYLPGMTSWEFTFEKLNIALLPARKTPSKIFIDNDKLELKWSFDNVIYLGKGCFTELTEAAPYMEPINISGKIMGDGILMSEKQVK